MICQCHIKNKQVTLTLPPLVTITTHKHYIIQLFLVGLDIDFIAKRIQQGMKNKDA